MKRSCSIWIIVRTCFNQLQSQMFCSPMRRYVHWCSSSKATALQPPTACPYTHCPYILVRMLIEICNKFDKIVMVHACNSQFKKVMSWWNLLHSPIIGVYYIQCCIIWISGYFTPYIYTAAMALPTRRDKPNNKGIDCYIAGWYRVFHRVDVDVVITYLQ